MQKKLPALFTGFYSSSVKYSKQFDYFKKFFCCNFASNVRGADVPAFQKIVEDSWSTRYIYRFLMYVKKANKLPLCEFMIVHGNIYDNLRIKNAMPKIYKEAKLELEKKSQKNSDTKEM